MKNYNCKSVAEMITVLESTVDYLEKKDATNLGDLFTTNGKKVNAGLNNYTIVAKEYKDDLGMGSYQAQPWCDMYVSNMFAYCFGLDLGKKLCKGWFSYVKSHADTFKAAGLTNQKPKVGDIVFFWSASLARYGHSGIVVGVDSNGVGFTTIEGNTTSGNNIVERNGGAVARKHYNTLPAQVLFGHVEYEKNGIPMTVEPGPVPYPETVLTNSDRQLIAIGPMNVMNDRDEVVGTLQTSNVFSVSKKRYVDGVTQFLIKHHTVEGWMVPDKATGWLREADGNYWYLEEGYTWPAAKIAVIDGAAYYFNDSGYCVFNDEITFAIGSSGVITTAKK